MKTVQVLLAVYNGEQFIEEQITSILNQSYPLIHLIIRDNASQDATKAIIKKIVAEHPGKITLISSPTNDGVIGNFAKLAEASSADYVMFSDADDIWQQDKVAQSLEKMQQLEEIHGPKFPLLVHTDLTIVNRDQQLIHSSFWKYSNLVPEKGHYLSRQLVQNVITGCTVLTNRPLLDLALPFPHDIVMHDWWLGLVAIALGKVACIDKQTMLYRQHGGNDTGAKRYGMFSFLKRFNQPKERNKLRLNAHKKLQQAKCLQTRYAEFLSHSDRETLEAFTRLHQVGFFEKRRLMLKFKFYKQGFLRNLIEFLPLEWLLKC
ncbi:dTDP-rhamnosyl transferase RfbG [Chlamydiales bacterium STE3]|nr:dTDP-rhamnosyl transferase RfbG [Chlamydiales bacterium STE3]